MDTLFTTTPHQNSPQRNERVQTLQRCASFDTIFVASYQLVCEIES